MQLPYSWSFDNTLKVYKFQSNNCSEYRVALYEVGEMYFSNYPAIKALSYEIAFEPSVPPSRPDNKVSITIVDIVKSLLQDGKIITFICESVDGRQKSRHILFRNWFKKHGDGFQKYDLEICDDEHCYYLSLMLHTKKHSNGSTIFDVFQRAINEYSVIKNI